MSTRNKILAGVVVILFVCLVVWVVRTTPKEPPPIEKFDPPTVMEYEGNTLTEEKDGKIIWELTCDKMRVDSITQDMELTNVRGKFYDDDDETWNLTAERGIYDRTEQIIYVEGEVVITNTDNDKLTSDELTWLIEKQTLNAVGNVNVTNEDGARVIADKLEWFTAEDKIIATDNVDIINDDGARLLSDKLEWLMAEEKVIATGNVKISKDDMRGYGDFAYAENNFKKFGLMGNAKVLKGVKEGDF